MLDCQLDANGQPKKPSNSTSSKADGHSPKKDIPRLMSCREHMELQRVQQQESNAPDPWLVRKFAVGIVVGVFGYSYYVFVVRLCVPMIRMEDSRLGGRAQGLVYLVIYHALFVLFCWSYAVAISTPPGFARDYVPQTDPPAEDAEYITVGQRYEEQPLSPRLHTPEGGFKEVPTTTVIGKGRELDGDALEMVEKRQSLVSAPTGGVRHDDADRVAESAPAAGALGPALATALTSARSSGVAGDPSSPTDSSPATAPSPSTRERERCYSTSGATAVSNSSTAPTVPTFPPQAHLIRKSSSPTVTTKRPSSSSFARRLSSESNAHAPSFLHFPEPPEDYEPPKWLRVERIPNRVPVLTEQYRYDAREGIVRPFRSHRCRHCAAVVLKMDHHCPWVGTCVGARNYKYFYNFLQSSTAYTLFVFLSLLIAQTLPLHTFPASRPYPGVDGQQLAIIAVAFLFFVFTGGLFLAHTRLVLRNMSTIEEIGMNRMKQRERLALNDAYGFWGIRSKRAVRREWDKQWGRLGREGNLWWLGSRRANWEMVMGKDKWAWFLPIPARPTGDDGLHYVPNPRFSPEGFWRPRKEWPRDLR
ncbi:hypothetical protein JCM5296_002575 [Sporobolomyces johnsonii]